MPLIALIKLLALIVVLVVIRVLAFKLFKPSADLPSLPVETTTARSIGEETLPPVSVWSVVVLIGVIAGLVVGLMVFGNAIGG